MNETLQISTSTVGRKVCKYHAQQTSTSHFDKIYSSQNCSNVKPFSAYTLNTTEDITIQTKTLFTTKCT